MVDFKAKMSEQKTSKYPANYPPGIYRFRVSDHVLAASKTAGNPPYLQFEVELAKLKKATNSANSKYVIPDGALRQMRAFFTPKTKEKTIAFLKQLGFTGTSLAQLDRDQARQRNVQFFSLAGAEFDGTIKLGEKNQQGKQYDEVGFFVDEEGKGGGLLGKVNRASASAVANLEALWRGVTPAHQQVAESEPPTSGVDEDVPF